MPPNARRRSLLAVALGVLAILAAAPAPLPASATRVGFKEAFAASRGNAFVATADNPSAIYYNPAGLTQIEGQEILASTYSIRLGSDYRSGLTGRTSSLKNETQTLPHFYYGWKQPRSKWALGVGFYAPFGLSTDWNGSTDLLEFATRNRETYTTLNVAFAYELTDTLSVAGGLTYNHLKVDLRQGVYYSVLAPAAAYRFEADGSAAGYTLGLRWQPGKRHAFGLSYQARTRFDISGTSSLPPLLAAEPARANFVFPEVLIAGYSFRPAPAWNIEANVDWTNWSCVNTVTISKASGATPLVFNWRSSCFYELGATRYFKGGWNASGGLTWSENSVPDSSWNPAMPDVDRLFWNAGIGYSGSCFRATLALQVAPNATRRIHNGGRTLFGSTYDGTYDNSIKALSLSLDYRF